MKLFNLSLVVLLLVSALFYNPSVFSGYEDDKENRELFLQSVEIVVDLPWFGDYQDSVASYAYATCKKAEQAWKITPKNNGYNYSCENLVKTWNSESGGWSHEVESPKNSNWTADYGYCQLNSARHSDFIFQRQDSPNGAVKVKGREFLNPLRQLDYCLGVWIDASNRGLMPWYGYKHRNSRDRGIKFLQEDSDYIQYTEQGDWPKLANDQFVEDETKKCERIGYSKMDYIQLDTYDWTLHWSIDIPKDQLVKIYKCERK